MGIHVTSIKRGFFKIRNTWKRDKQKIVLGFLGLVSLSFFNIWKRDDQKNCARFFRDCKYASFNIWKWNKQKIALDFLEFVSMLF